MKTTKRFAALLMAVVMVFALCSTALADEQSGVKVSTDGIIPIEKHINMTNNTPGTYWSPNVTFEYTITPATTAELNLNSQVGGATVLSGPTGGLIAGNDTSVTTNTVSYTQTDPTAHDPAQVGDTDTVTDGRADNGKVVVSFSFISKEVSDVNSKGKDVSETMNLVVVPAAFPHAGIYRYKIADTTPDPNLDGVGIVRSSGYAASTVRFIDVYIQNNPAGPGLAPAGSVIAKETTGSNQVPEKNNNGEYIDDRDNGITYDPVYRPADNTVVPPDPGNPHQYYVDDDGYLWEQKDPADDPDDLTFPDDYDRVLKDPSGDDSQANQVKVKLEDNGNLSKEGEGYNAEPEKEFVDAITNGSSPVENTPDDVPDKIADNGTFDPDHDEIPDVPSPGDGVEPLYDDDGDIIGSNNEHYPQPEYKVDPTTGEIYEDKDGNGTKDDGEGTGAYQTYRGTYSYEGDSYPTFNISVKKIVEGAMGDKANNFPFEFDVSNVGVNFKVSTSDADAVDDWRNGQASTATPIATTITVNDALHNEEALYVRGLSAIATYGDITETNNTNETYSVVANDFKGGNKTTAANATAMGGTHVYTGSGVITDYSSSSASPTEEDRSHVVFTNTLETISPTGIALRYAPYIFMLAAAAMFVVLSRRERDGENA